MKVLILTPFKTASHSLYNLLLELEIPVLRTHGYVHHEQRSPFSPQEITHIITLDRQDKELWMLSRYFQDIENKKDYPYAYGYNQQQVLEATPEQLLHHFRQFDWSPFINDLHCFTHIQKMFGIKVIPNEYGIYQGADGKKPKVYYDCLEHLESHLDMLADFLNLDLKTLEKHFEPKNCAHQKWYGPLYEQTRQILMESRQS